MTRTKYYCFSALIEFNFKGDKMITSLIRNRANSLTEAEAKIASVIISCPKNILNMTAKELANEAKVAPSAVIRLCKSLGLDGFSTLKIQLAQEIGHKKDINALPSFNQGDSAEEVFHKVFASGINTLNDTLSMMDFSKIKTIAEKMVKAERIIFFGVGTSSVIATDAHYRFSQLGISASACTDILFMNVAAINLTEKDLAVGISHSGRTRATVDAMRKAKAAGAETVAITSFSDSLLYKECDHSIAVFSDEENYPVEAVSARVAHICILDAFMMTIATMKYDSFADHISARNKILQDIRYS